MNYPIEILLEQKTLLETELVFTEGKELTETKQKYAEVCIALNTLNLDTSESDLNKHFVTYRRELFDNFYKWYDSLTVAESDEHSLTSAIETYFFKIIK